MVVPMCLTGHALFHASLDDVSALICMFFGISTGIDLVFGYLFYRDQLGWFSSWSLFRILIPHDARVHLS